MLGSVMLAVLLPLGLALHQLVLIIVPVLLVPSRLVVAGMDHRGVLVPVRVVELLPVMADHSGTGLIVLLTNVLPQLQAQDLNLTIVSSLDMYPVLLVRLLDHALWMVKLVLPILNIPVIMEE